MCNVHESKLTRHKMLPFIHSFIFFFLQTSANAEMDDEDCERRRVECIDEMTNLEKQFTDLKDQCVYLLFVLIPTLHKKAYFSTGNVHLPYQVIQRASKSS